MWSSALLNYFSHLVRNKLGTYFFPRVVFPVTLRFEPFDAQIKHFHQKKKQKCDDISVQLDEFCSSDGFISSRPGDQQGVRIDASRSSLQRRASSSARQPKEAARKQQQPQKNGKNGSQEPEREETRSLTAASPGRKPSNLFLK